jgi:hypothetical protein
LPVSQDETVVLVQQGLQNLHQLLLHRIFPKSTGPQQSVSVF